MSKKMTATLNESMHAVIDRSTELVFDEEDYVKALSDNDGDEIKAITQLREEKKAVVLSEAIEVDDVTMVHDRDVGDFSFIGESPAKLVNKPASPMG